MSEPILTERNIGILEVLLNSGDINQTKMAEKIGLSDAGMKLALQKMEDAKLIETYLDRDNGRIVKKIRLKLNSDDTKKIIHDYKKVKSTLENAVAVMRMPKRENK